MTAIERPCRGVQLVRFAMLRLWLPGALLCTALTCGYAAGARSSPAGHDGALMYRRAMAAVHAGDAGQARRLLQQIIASPETVAPGLFPRIVGALARLYIADSEVCELKALGRQLVEFARQQPRQRVMVAINALSLAAELARLAGESAEPAARLREIRDLLQVVDDPDTRAWIELEVAALESELAASRAGQM